MGKTAHRQLRRRITGLILERITFAVVPLVAGLLLLAHGLPWAVRLGGLPLAAVLLWLTFRNGLRPGLQRCVSGSWLLLGILRRQLPSYWARRLPQRSLPGTRYGAPVFPDGADADLLVVSDLHVTVRPDRHALEHDAFDAPVHALVDGLLPALRPQACLLTGDLTDTGSADAWRRLTRRFAPWRAAGVELMAVAGNHDVHFRRLEVAAERLGVPALGGYFRALVSHPSAVGACSHPPDRTARRLARLTGERADGRPAPPLAPRLRTCERLGADFLLLDSNQRPSHSPVSQAIGFVGPAQLAAAQALLDARAVRRPVSVALHHHLLPPGPAARAQPFLACLDAAEVLAFAERNQVEAVFHGHLHTPYVADHVYRDADGRSRRMRIVSAGSALYPAEGPFAAEVGGASVVAADFEDGRIVRLGFVPASRILRVRAARPAEAADAADAAAALLSSSPRAAGGHQGIDSPA